MNLTIRKLFCDYENEEKWLNAMSKKGYAMIQYSFYKYTFTECQPEEFTYKIELLDILPNDPDCGRYINSLCDSGTEVVCTYMKWVYFRKKTAGGPIQISNDNKTKLKYFEKILMMWYLFMIAEFSIGIGNIFMSINVRNFLNIFMGVSIAMIGLAILFSYVLPLYRKIKKLKKE